jgi:uncharacterized protein with WD repeat
MAAFTPFPEAVPVSEYQLTYRTSGSGVVSMKMSPTGTPPTQVFQKQDGFWFSYSPDGKYLAVVVADMEKAVISAAKLAALSNARPVGEGVAPDAIANTSGSLHPATPRWLEIIDATTFQTLHRLEGVAGLEEYFYWSPRSHYLVTWQPLSVPMPSASYTGGVGPSPTSTPPPQSSSSSTNSSNSTSNSAISSLNSSSVESSHNLKVWDVQTGKVVMQFKHGQRQGWPIVRWTEDEKIAARWASGQIHLYHWATATFHQSPEENFAAMKRETIDKKEVWDWSVARSALAIFIRPNNATNAPGQVHLYPLNTSLGEDQSQQQQQQQQQQSQSIDDSSESLVGTLKKQKDSSSSQSSSSPSSKQSQQQQQQPGGKKGKGGNAKGGGGGGNNKNAKSNQIPLNTAPPKEPEGLSAVSHAGASEASNGSQKSQQQQNNGSSQELNASSGENNSQQQQSSAATSSATSSQQQQQSSVTMAPEIPSCSKVFYKCDDIQFRWHNRGQALLVLATTQRDESGSNHYYGNTSVYYLPADGKGECDVVTDKPGPIHDVRWNAKGNDFAVTYGEYPSKTTLYNRKCKALGHLGTESRNELVWSPQGRVLMSGGFGQLPGNFDIWDTVSLSKLGSAQSFTSALHEWSPDGKYLLTAALWPRMRVDNFFSLYDLKANHIFLLKLQELWKIAWRPQPGCSSAYPTSPQEPILIAPPSQIVAPSASSSKAPTASSTPYRPPGAKRAANSQFAQSQVPLKEAKVAPERFAPPSNPNPPKQRTSSSHTSSPASSSTSSPPTKVPIGGIPVKKSSASPQHRQPNNKNQKQ